MIRTFIALEISAEVKTALARDLVILKGQAPLVKWSRLENLHLTLRFLGDVKEDDLQELFDVLEEWIAPCRAFALEMKGIGVFPNWRHPRVVWAGCGEGSDDAVQLADVVKGACFELGYEREKRPFQPHLTLGRVKLPADAMGLEGAAAALLHKVYGFLDADAVVVFMSSLRRTGPVYSPMARIELTGM